MPNRLMAVWTLPEPLYRLAVDTSAQHEANEMIYLVGLYSLYRRRSMASTCLSRAGIGPESYQEAE
jgi:hypothetical protein